MYKFNKSTSLSTQTSRQLILRLVSFRDILLALIYYQARDEGRTLKPEDLGDKVADTGFLNALQSGLNNWQKDIQKVTKLDRFVTWESKGRRGGGEGGGEGGEKEGKRA
jgi:hypothetical protein